MNIFKHGKYQRFIMAVSAIGLVCMGSQSAIAQNSPERGGPEARIERMIDELDITEAQQNEFRTAMAAIGEERMRPSKAMRDERREQRASREDREPRQSGSRGDGRKEMERRGSEAAMERRAEVQERNEEILSSVLTEEQLAKFRELESARMARMSERAGR
jgi:Spy/CpxP family protein refolding chaperone